MITIHARDDIATAVLAVGYTVFFRQSAFSADHLRQTAVELARIAPFATWYRSGTMPRNASATSASFGSLLNVSDADRPPRQLFLFVDSGEPGDAVGECALRLSYDASKEDSYLGYFQCHEPIETFLDAPAELYARFANFVERAPVLHGYCGFSINYDHGNVDHERDVAMRAFCERFSGVNLTDLLTESEALMDRIKGAQWLTYISNELLESEAEAADDLRAQPAAKPMGSGILLQACPKPQLGDRHAQADMSAYRAINRLLAPWLVDTLWPMPGFPDEEAVRGWLHKLRSEA
jgi:hypothetical protein